MYLLNTPYNGGTHLPDLTVVTPVFNADGARILFWVGSRGHHADIGGISPGSMPPNSVAAGSAGEAGGPRVPGSRAARARGRGGAGLRTPGQLPGLAYAWLRVTGFARVRHRLLQKQADRATEKWGRQWSVFSRFRSFGTAFGPCPTSRGPKSTVSRLFFLPTAQAP